MAQPAALRRDDDAHRAPAHRVDVHIGPRERLEAMAADVRRGLTAQPRWLPPKYFYDAAGSRLFDEITRLPEYYLTRAETRIIAALAPSLMAALAPRDVIELGSGFSVKTRHLLGAAVNGSLRYVPVDVDEETVEAAARRLRVEYPGVHVHGVIGDFERHLPHVPASIGRRLVLFLGSTIGNFHEAGRERLLASIRDLLAPGDRLLLGLDLVKDPQTLEAAYNDRAGVTAQFNRNILRVVNRALDGDFDADAFRHHAWYNSEASRIEMHLVATAPQTVRIGRLGLTARFAAGDGIWTESSYKFSRPATGAMLQAAGLRLLRWHTDSRRRFAVVLAGPASER